MSTRFGPDGMTAAVEAARRIVDVGEAALGKSPGSPECTRYHADTFTFGTLVARALLDAVEGDKGNTRLSGRSFNI